jgi:hypothetical protein
VSACEHCGTELAPAVEGDRVAWEPAPDGGVRPHDLERCRDALKARVATALRERDEAQRQEVAARAMRDDYRMETEAAQFARDAALTILRDARIAHAEGHDKRALKIIEQGLEDTSRCHRCGREVCFNEEQGCTRCLEDRAYQALAAVVTHLAYVSGSPLRLDKDLTTALDMVYVATRGRFGVPSPARAGVVAREGP